MKVGFIGLGCEKNMVNTEQMIHKVRAAGHTIVERAEDADAVVINTCGFIEAAKKEAIETIMEMAQLKKEGKIKKIILCGCLVERYKDSIAEEIFEADGFVGVGSFDEIAEVLDETAKGVRVQSYASPDALPLEGERVRTTAPFTAYLKIADGCNNRCAYCAIPVIRGPYRSRTIESIVSEAEQMAAEGVKELILIAQDTTNYGVDLYGQRRLCDLLRQLVKTDGICWIRLLYLYPDKITDELLDLIASEEKMLHYIEMPIQHSQARILKKMNRPGDRDSLLKLMEKIRKKIPDAVIRTTLIAGFPEETEEDFEGLCRFVKEARFDRLGVFPYSREEGTPAYSRKGQLSEEEKQRRAEIVEDIQSEIVYEKLTAAVGSEYTVLAEGYDRLAECWYGRSYGEAPDIDGKIFFTGKDIHTGQFVKVEITDILDFDLIGRKVQ